MPFRKGKKEKSLQNLFYEDAEMVHLALNSLSLAVKSFCSGSDENKTKYIDEVIGFEKKQDRLREEIFRRLFGRESMVFSRPDRVLIVDMMDDIVDAAEITARKLSLYHPDISSLDKVMEKITEISEKISPLGVKYKDLIDGLMNDFDKAKRLIVEITDIRREIRELEWKSLSELYNLKPDFFTFKFIEDLIENLGNTSDQIEASADRIYAIICKYSF